MFYYLHEPGDLHYGGMVQSGFGLPSAAQNIWRAMKD